MPSPYYDCLGIQPDFFRQRDANRQLEKIYHKKALAAHPDKNGGATQAFQDLQAAYSTLRDPHLRAIYDAECKEAPNEPTPQEPSERLKAVFTRPCEWHSQKIFYEAIWCRIYLKRLDKHRIQHQLSEDVYDSLNVALTQAVNENNTNAVKALLAQGAFPNVINLTFPNSQPIMNQLLQDIHTLTYQTPRDPALLHAKEEILSLLIESVNNSDNFDVTLPGVLLGVLDAAIQYAHLPSVQLLLKKSADPKARYWVSQCIEYGVNRDEYGGDKRNR